MLLILRVNHPDAYVRLADQAGVRLTVGGKEQCCNLSVRDSLGSLAGATMVLAVTLKTAQAAVWSMSDKWTT